MHPRNKGDQFCVVCGVKLDCPFTQKRALMEASNMTMNLRKENQILFEKERSLKLYM